MLICARCCPMPGTWWMCPNSCHHRSSESSRILHLLSKEKHWVPGQPSPSIAALFPPHVKTSVLNDMLEGLDPPCASTGILSLCMAAICQFSWKLEVGGVTIYSDSAGYYWGRTVFSLYLSLLLKPKCGSELDPHEPRAKAHNPMFSISANVYICVVPWSVLSPFAKDWIQRRE